MENKISNLFKSSKGLKIYKDFEHAVNLHNMHEAIKSGVLLGFSGGADSVMLLCLLTEFQNRNGNFKITAVHINHLIRDSEAFRDEEFSKSFAEKLGVEFVFKRMDVPALAKASGKGIEETARDIRYSAFQNIISSRNDISTIVTAHNSTDNFETVILNMMRGAGATGLSGIAPVRQNIIRPLIYSSKSDIVCALTEAAIPFVTDSTNCCIDYNRNYVRHEIIPKFLRFSTEPERLISRMSDNIRADSEFIDTLAQDFLDKEASHGRISLSSLSKLHRALLSRVLIKFIRMHTEFSPELNHISKIAELISANKKYFSVSLPGSVSFILENSYCRIGKIENCKNEYCVKLKCGFNEIKNTPISILVSDRPPEKTFSNVYKIAIHRAFDFDIIDGEMSARSKRDGDAYIYGGMTHKLKKLFNDKKIPPRIRSLIPIISDQSGILWVPGFSSRDGANLSKTASKIYVSVLLTEDIDGVFEKLLCIDSKTDKSVSYVNNNI